MGERRTWTSIKASRPDTPERRAGYAQARLAHELGQQVRELRLQQGLSQAQLAKLMHTSQAQIARLELGGTSPSIQTLERLSEVLGVPLTVRFERAASA